jgi:hypothetical protein
MSVALFLIVVVPMAFAVVFGANLLARGIRGVPTFTAPQCVRSVLTTCAGRSRTRRRTARSAGRICRSGTR